MKVLTTGMPRRAARAATRSSAPKRRTSTSTMMQGLAAVRSRARISAATSSTAASSTGLGGSTGTGPHGACTRSRGSSRYTGSDRSWALRSTRAMSDGARAGSSSTAMSQVISRKMRVWVSISRLMWCSRQPLPRSCTPGAPLMTTTGTRSA